MCLRSLQEVISPLRGFVKDDTILLHARLVCPGPDTHADSALSSSQSQSHSTSSLPTSSQSPVSQNHAHSLWPQGTGSNSTHHQTLPSFTRSLPQSLSASSCVQALVFSQSSQNSEGSQLTPTSTAVLPTEMAAFFSCPRCSERYKEEGKKAPNTLHCGHTFCLGEETSGVCVCVCVCVCVYVCVCVCMCVCVCTLPLSCNLQTVLKR